MRMRVLGLLAIAVSAMVFPLVSPAVEDRFAAFSNHFTSGEGMSSAGFV